MKKGQLVKGPIMLKRDAALWNAMIPLVILTEPHTRKDDPSGVLYITVQAQNAAGPPHDIPVSDVEPA